MAARPLGPMPLAALAILAAATTVMGELSPTPVMKVLKLLDKLKKQSEDEGQKEAIAYDKFACFCKHQAQSKLDSISDGDAKIELFGARIKKLSAEIVELDADVTETNTKLEELEVKIADAAAKRDKEHAVYVSKRNDLLEAVRGADEAIQMMQASKHEGFLQTGSMSKFSDVVERASFDGALSGLSSAQTERLTSLLEAAGMPATGEATASKYHSAKIIDTLTSVLKDFKNQKNTVEESESSAKHEFDMAQAARNNQLKAFKAAVAKNEEIIAGKEAQKQDNENLKQKTTDAKDADQKFLDSLVAQCEATAKAWDARSQTRANELMAITEATEIIRGKVAAMYGSNKKLNLLSTEEGAHGHWEWVPDQVSLLQTGRPRHSSSLLKLVRFLKRQAKILKSPSLSTLVLRMKEDHFVKVRTMIKDLAAKLKADAEAEQTQKGWCDEEMNKATTKRDKNIGNIEGDTASVTETKALLDQLANDISELSVQIADLYKALNEATKLRKEEKADNKKTVDDATAGLGAIKAAIKVLKDFYDESLLQTGESGDPDPPVEKGSVQDLAPKTGLEGDFKGNQAASKGIIGLMEVIQSDFEGTIEETNSAEKEGDEEYKKFKEESENLIGEKKELVRSKKEEVNDAKGDLLGFRDELKEHNALKTEALAELAKLQPACVATGMSYQERVARREQEIRSLKNAYKILDDMSFLQKRRRHL